MLALQGHTCSFLMRKIRGLVRTWPRKCVRWWHLSTWPHLELTSKRMGFAKSSTGLPSQVFKLLQITVRLPEASGFCNFWLLLRATHTSAWVLVSPGFLVFGKCCQGANDTCRKEMLSRFWKTVRGWPSSLRPVIWEQKCDSVKWVSGSKTAVDQQGSQRWYQGSSVEFLPTLTSILSCLPVKFAKKAHIFRWNEGLASFFTLPVSLKGRWYGNPILPSWLYYFLWLQY